jgi:Protein of unknown function (DUF2914)
MKGVCMKAFMSAVYLAVMLFGSFSFAQDSASAKKSPSAMVFTVDSMVFAAGIDAKAPVGVNAEFEASAGKVSCWTKVTSSQAPTSLKHIWYKDDKKVFELPLVLKSQSGRLWSTKSVSTGNWKVEIVDDAGTVVKSGTFIVK